MNPLISVIVPVYKTEEYLSKCVESILDQTYQNLEVILIDDGSPDRCPEICDKYARNDSRVRVVHQKNGGLSDARNAGISRANGKYIGFVDSDDYIACDMYEALYRLLAEADAEIAVCNFYWVTDEVSRPFPLPFSGSAVVLNSLEAAKELLLSGKLQNYAWNKLYRADLFHGVRYPAGKYFEDIYTTYRLILKSSKVTMTEAPKYYYYQRENSICGELSPIASQDNFDAQQTRLLFMKENHPELERYCYRSIAENFIGTFGTMHKREIIAQNRALLDSMKKCIVKERHEILKNKFVPISYRAAVALLLFNEDLYFKMRGTYLHRKAKFE